MKVKAPLLAVDRELRRIRTARNGEGQRIERSASASVAVTVVTAVVFSATEIAPWPRRYSLVITGVLSFTFGHGDRNGLVSILRAVRHLHRHVVDVVRARVRRGLEVRRSDECKAPLVLLIANFAASAPPASEKVSASGRSIRVRRRDRRHRRRVLGNRSSRPWPRRHCDVITGALLSFTFVTVTAMAWVSILVPSDT